MDKVAVTQADREAIGPTCNDCLQVAEAVREAAAAVADRFAAHEDGDDEDADQFDKGYSTASRSISSTIRSLDLSSIIEGVK